MSYKLTLTADERRAMDWIGDRYFHGDELRRLLWSQCEQSGEWDDSGDLTFIVPEHIAWQIRDGFQNEDYSFACLSAEFASKLMAFADSII